MTGCFTQGLAQRRLHVLPYIAIRIQPVEQETDTLMLDAPPLVVAQQRHLGFAAHPFGQIDHPVGTHMPVRIRIGAAHQRFDLRQIARVIGVMPQRAATEPAPDRADS